MNKSARVSLGIFLGLVLVASGVMAAKPENRWHRIGKTAHAKARTKSAKARDHYCTTACRKAGAHKATDLGACKEGCVFG